MKETYPSHPRRPVPALNQLLQFLSLVTQAEPHRNPTVRAELAASNRALSACC
jgi:tryptophanyl-tRNA synthetase